MIPGALAPGWDCIHEDLRQAVQALRNTQVMWLTGVLGALLAAGLEPAMAAAAAVHAQELAATLAARGGTHSGAPAPASAIQVALTGAIRTLRSAARMRG